MLNMHIISLFFNFLYLVLAIYALGFEYIWGDTLGGHLDDMEADWSKPIVSLRYYAIFSPSLYFGLYRNMWKERLTSSMILTIYFPLCLSLGCKAIFLLGGKSREDPPLAMFLRSGDVVLMAGEARECFHGRLYN